MNRAVPLQRGLGSLVTLLVIAAVVIGGVGGFVEVASAQTLTVDDDGSSDHNTIQAAIDAAKTGDTIDVKPGTYDEDLAITTEGLTLEGPNAGLAGDSDERGDEATITDANGRLVIEASDVTIDGLNFEFDESAIQSKSGDDNLITNSRFELTGTTSDTYAIRVGGGSPGTDVTNNLFTDIVSNDGVSGDNVNGVVVTDPRDTRVANNVFSSVDTAVNAGDQDPEAGTLVVENNEFSDITQFGAVALVNDDAGLDADINNNTIKSSRIGIGVFAGDSSATFSIQDNDFQNFANDEVFVDDQAGVLTLDDVLNTQGNTFDRAVTVETSSGDIIGNRIFGGIQKAVTSASSGETVVAEPGTYQEDLDIDTDVSLISAGSPDDTEIAVENDENVEISTADAVVDGFTINKTASSGSTDSTILFSAPGTLNNSVVQDSSSGGTGIGVSTPTGEVNIEDNRINQSDVGIAVDATNSNDRVSVDNVTINGTNKAGIDINGVHNSAAVNVTNSTLTENEEAVRLSNSAGDAQVNVHFNKFEENVVGVADDPGTVDATHNLTFNDFINNTDAVVLDDGISGTVNANYSWWGSDAGPNSAGGDSVSLSSSADATTEPFLLQSAVDNYDESNLGGTNVLRFGHNVEVTNNKGAVSFPTTANRTAGASIDGNSTDVMVYKLVDGQFVDAGAQVPDTMEGHVIDLTESSRTSAYVTISYSDDVQDGLGGITYEQGQNLVGPPTQGDTDASTTLGLDGNYVISPFLKNTDDKFELDGELDVATGDASSSKVSPFKAYIVEVPDADDNLTDRFRGGNVPGGTDASEIEDLLTNSA